MILCVIMIIMIIIVINITWTSNAENYSVASSTLVNYILRSVCTPRSHCPWVCITRYIPFYTLILYTNSSLILQVQVSRPTPRSRGASHDCVRWWCPGDSTKAYSPWSIAPYTMCRSRSTAPRVGFGRGVLRPLPDEARKSPRLLRDWCKTPPKGQHRQAGRSIGSTSRLWSTQTSWQHSWARGKPNQPGRDWWWLRGSRNCHFFARLM